MVYERLQFYRKVARESLPEKMVPCENLRGVMEQAIGTSGWECQAEGMAREVGSN